MTHPAHTKGITLVETLVAISIVLLAITGPMVHIQDSLNNARYAQDQMVATYLAQEGVEIIRAIRDSNWLAEDPSFSGIDSCLFPAVCTVDATKALDDALEVCPAGDIIGAGDCEPLTVTNGVYGYRANGEISRFTRSLTVRSVPNNSEEREVVVDVAWVTRPGKGRTVRVQENIFDFQ